MGILEKRAHCRVLPVHYVCKLLWTGRSLSFPSAHHTTSECGTLRNLSLHSPLTSVSTDRVAFCQCQVPFLQLLADWQSSAGEFDRYFTGFWDKIIILRGGCTVKFDYLVPTHLLSYPSNGFPVVLLVVADQNPVLVCQFPSQIPHPLPQDRQGK